MVMPALLTVNPPFNERERKLKRAFKRNRRMREEFLRIAGILYSELNVKELECKENGDARSFCLAAKLDYKPRVEHYITELFPEFKEPRIVYLGYPGSEGEPVKETTYRSSSDLVYRMLYVCIENLVTLRVVCSDFDVY